MSKSLKNFITIKDLLGNSNSKDYSSRADDFRLWCFALSGNIRGPTTYTETRMEEAKVGNYVVTLLSLNSKMDLKI